MRATVIEPAALNPGAGVGDGVGVGVAVGSEVGLELAEGVIVAPDVEDAGAVPPEQPTTAMTTNKPATLRRIAATGTRRNRTI